MTHPSPWARRARVLLRGLPGAAVCLGLWAPGCGGDVEPVVNGVSFNPLLTTDLAAGQGLGPDQKFRPMGSPGVHLVTDAVPRSATPDHPRSPCYWAPTGSEVNLSWEVALNVSVPDHINMQNLGTCTLTHPTTRQPMIDTDGDPVEISQEDWEDFFDDNAFAPTVRIARRQSHAGRPDACVPATGELSTTTSTSTPGAQRAWREPLCMRGWTETLSAGPGSSDGAQHGDSTYAVTIAGSYNGVEMPAANKSFSTSFKGVSSGGRVIRRPLTPSNGPGWYAWHAGYTNLQGPWDENFSLDLFISSVQVVAVDANGLESFVGMRGLQAVAVDGQTLGRDVCPIPPGGVGQPDYTTLSFHTAPGNANCPGLIDLNPTQELSWPHRLVKFGVWLPEAPEGQSFFIEFNVASVNPNGLTAGPGAYDPQAAYPGFWEWVRERFRASNFGKNRVRLNIEFDENGNLLVDIPEDGTVIPPGHTVTVPVAVTAEEAGRMTEESFSFTLTDVDTGEVLQDGTVVIPVEGQKATYSITPAPGPNGVAFTAQTGHTQHFVLENTGPVDINIAQVVLPGSPLFSLSNLPAPTLLVPGDTYAFDVTFSAQTGVSSYGTLVIASDAGVRSVPLFGTP